MERYETGLQKAFTIKPDYPPGARFIYSDINFNLLERSFTASPDNHWPILLIPDLRAASHERKRVLAILTTLIPRIAPPKSMTRRAAVARRCPRPDRAVHERGRKRRPFYHRGRSRKIRHHAPPYGPDETARDCFAEPR